MKPNCLIFLQAIATLAPLFWSPDLSAAARCSSVHSAGGQNRSFGNIQTSYFDQFLARYGVSSDRHSGAWNRIWGPVDSQTYDYGTPDRPQLSIRMGLRDHPEFREKEAAQLPPITESHFSNFEIPSSKLEIQDQNQNEPHQFKLLNVGFRQLEKDWPLIEKSFTNGIKQNPDKEVVITYHPAFVRARDILAGYHRWCSLMATNVYSKRKNYLNEDDLYELRNSDWATESHDDYLVLQKDSMVSPMEMTFEQFEANTLAVVRLVRVGYGDILFPQNIIGRHAYEALPVSKRFRGTATGQRIEEAISRLYYLGGKNIAEISRFVRMQDMPGVLMNSLVKNIFELALRAEQPTDILIISVDAKTRALFQKQYKFKDLAPLTDGKDSTPEFLMYHDTHSKEFHDVLENLKISSSSVTQVPSRVRTTFQQKPDENSRPKDWYSGSLEEKVTNTKKKIKDFREQHKFLKPTIKWNMDLLKDVPPTDPGRIIEIARWAFHNFLNQQIRSKYDQLTAAEKMSLTERATAFSNQFESLAIEALSGIKKGDEVLILGRDSAIYKKMVRQEIDPQNIYTGGLSSLKSQTSNQYDKIILTWDNIQNRSEGEIKTILTNAHRSLKPSGVLTIIAPFAYASPMHTRLSENDFVLYANEILKNGSPVSEKELALELIARLQHIKQVDSGWLEFAPLSNILYDLGFRGGMGFHPSPDLYGGMLSTLLKPKESDQ